VPISQSITTALRAFFVVEAGVTEYCQREDISLRVDCSGW
jgi:hypothetical protein